MVYSVSAKRPLFLPAPPARARAPGGSTCGPGVHIDSGSAHRGGWAGVRVRMSSHAGPIGKPADLAGSGGAMGNTQFDLVIAGGEVVTPDAVRRVDVGVRGEK